METKKREMIEKAERLIADNNCILLDRIAWGKDYRATILIPPPHGDASKRDTEPKQDGVEDYTFYNEVLDMLEGVFAIAEARELDPHTVVIFRTETNGIQTTMELRHISRAIEGARKKFEVK